MTAEPLSHGERLKKNMDDVKFVLILLSILIIIVGIWNFFNSSQVQELQDLRDRYSTVSENLTALATPEFLRKAKKIRERSNSKTNMKDLVKKYVTQGSLVKGDIWSTVDDTGKTEDFLKTPPIETITIDMLVAILESIKRESLDIVCTEIDKLEPLFDEEGYAQTGITEVKKDVKVEVVCYKIGSLRFSRFKKKE